MTVLVTGSTGTVGSEAVRALAASGTDVRALTRSPEKADLPDGVTLVKGDFTDPSVMREALDGVSGLFLLSPVALEELTGTLETLSMARDAGVRDVVYLSVIHADDFLDVPHSAAKAVAERLITDLGLSATLLRPSYFMQNDVGEKDTLLGGAYLPPVGNRSVLMVDVGDLGDVAAAALLERQRAEHALPVETIDVTEPQVHTGDSLAKIWSEVLDRPVSYGGDDLDAQDERLSSSMPGWRIYDMRRMMQRFQQDGMVAAPGTDERLQQLLGRPMRSYRDFAAATAASWSS